MCLGIPMKVISKKGDRAEVKSDRTTREISVGFVRDVSVGDYVIVHAGFAIEKINEKHAKETLKMLKEMQP